jgi:hypothetical protein
MTIIPSETHVTAAREDNQAPRGASIAKRPENRDTDEGWDRDVGQSTRRWSPRNAVSPWDDSSSDKAPQPRGTIDAGPTQAPRIFPTGIQPSSRSSAEAPPQRGFDALDEFEAQIQKNTKLNPGRSSSNEGTRTKPSIQPLPREQSPVGKSQVPRDQWPLRIEPRRDPPPMFAPEDLPARSKPTSEKQQAFDAGTDWSDLPHWQGIPNKGNPSTERDNGPAIRPVAP